MKARKYTEEQIITVLGEVEAGARVVDLGRKYGMSDTNYYNTTGRLSKPASPSVN